MTARVTSRARVALGRYGESAACRYLEESGMAIVARNWRCDLGEIDVVATEGDGLVLVEVKTRRTTTYGYPEESVGDAKLRRLRRLLARFLDESGMHPRWVRLDVVSVLLPRRGGPVISHLRDVS